MRRAVAVVSIAAAIGLVALAGLQAQQGPPRDAPVAPLVGTAAISGTVQSSPDAKPINRAQLMILGAENGYMKIVESDTQGRFSFAQLPAGRYMIGASRPPYSTPPTAPRVRDGPERRSASPKASESRISPSK